MTKSLKDSILEPTKKCKSHKVILSSGVPSFGVNLQLLHTLLLGNLFLKDFKVNNYINVYICIYRGDHIQFVCIQ